MAAQPRHGVNQGSAAARGGGVSRIITPPATGATTFTLPDTATGADALTVTATVTVSDAGNGAESLSTGVVVVGFSDMHVDDPVNATQINQIGALIAAQNPASVLFAGDCATNYTGTGVDNLGLMQTGLSATPANTLYPAEGNHDLVDGGGIGGKWGDYFRVQQGQTALPSSSPSNYSFDIPGANWHVVVLEGLPLTGSIDISATGASYIWLAADLAANAGKHIISIWHEPPFGYSTYSTSSTNNTTSAPTATYANNMTAWSPIRSLLHQYKCEMMLVGHQHYYARYLRFDNSLTVDPTWPVQIALGFTGGDQTNYHSYGPGPGYTTGPPYPLVDPTCGVAYTSTGGSPDNSATNIVKFVLRDNSFDVTYVGNGGSFADTATYSTIGPANAGAPAPTIVAPVFASQRSSSW